jgi:hypothetical protein
MSSFWLAVRDQSGLWFLFSKATGAAAPNAKTRMIAKSAHCEDAFFNQS